MTAMLLFFIASCFLATHQAHVIYRCDLAKLLKEEDLDGYEGYSLSDWICLASVESDFNISKVNENVDGSYDYGIFQINSHHWCNDHISHSENICHIDCKDLLTTDLIGAINCAKKILSKGEGMRNWARWKLHCEGRPLSYWITGCRLK
ncbi:lysozyme-like protein 6 [Suncus etruscus]|uniref:lysozyme-like protein 6 n=1 Tax=Suncus etruscus TaxID=109475 RepID=UPI00210F8A52|nr:lysozyme-like protein 6 [Suncus etruscus]